MKLAEFRDYLAGTALDDVLWAGFIATGEQLPRFYALHRTLFLECSGKLWRCGVVDDSGRLLIAGAEAVSCSTALDDDKSTWMRNSKRKDIHPTDLKLSAPND